MSSRFGAVVWRQGRPSQLQILLLHDIERDEWTLPTRWTPLGGPTGDDLAAFAHEVTGMTCQPGLPLPPIRCSERGGPSHRVHYWAMRSLEGAFKPNASFDEAWWLREHEIPAVAGHTHDVLAARAFARLHNATPWRLTIAAGA